MVTEVGNAAESRLPVWSSSGDKWVYSFDGTTDWLDTPDSADWDFGSGGFTLEAWVWLDSLSAYTCLFGQGVQSVCDGDGLYSFTMHSGVPYLFTSGFQGDQNFGGTAVSAGEWNHIAFCRSGSTLSCYINGEAAPNTKSTSTWGNIGCLFHIGRKVYSSANAMSGLMKDIRISDTARYTSNFLVPTEQFTSDANTLLLIRGGETKSGTTGSGATFTDSGKDSRIVTERGNAIAIENSMYKI